ncbi:hypothetical protein [Gordonia rhizosphera]|uniref:Uncharacterized protein n=1 Tax=Gordonia rhizosphera NBRC 16068 TaxID=1108045 RepID=K6V925_9ACTN|nr:hypothetical protein [Gordonia rhizosphera]GAB92723.1 hypothetical protein GORHZ_188_00150 [Gordonia rhizosphera NBRC 16068]
MTEALLEQLPHFSEYDPGAEGEGSLDPLGLSAIADRIADRLVPGLRARMSQPRFVSLAVAGAHACQPLRDLTSSDGRTTFDIAFEWIVVEAMVRHRSSAEIRGLPGMQKATRAQRVGRRLGSTTYLSGPRVFGFTGVYRPFALDSGALEETGMPGPEAEVLLDAWERDRGLGGFVSGASGSNGAKLRREIVRACEGALRAGEVTIAPGNKAMRRIAEVMAPSDAGSCERAVLRSFIVRSGYDQSHEIRTELCSLLLEMRHGDMSQRDVADAVMQSDDVSAPTRAALLAASTYEQCATAIEKSFRRILQDASAHGGGFSISQAAKTPHLSDIATALPAQVSHAIEAASNLDDQLAADISNCLNGFEETMDPAAFVNRLLSRHDQVQTDKQKRLWIDPHGKNWLVRPPYRNQSVDLTNTNWIHPMRLKTLANFLQETA